MRSTLGLDPFACHRSNTSFSAAASASFSVYKSIVIQCPFSPALPPTEFIQKSDGRFCRALLAGSLESSIQRFATKLRIWLKPSLSIMEYNQKRSNFKIATHKTPWLISSYQKWNTCSHFAGYTQRSSFSQ
jgi:hypothetical protein